jgi:hypothetical protein
VNRGWIAAFLVCGVASRVDGQSIDYTTAHLERRLEANRARGPITIDAVLGEAEWEGAAIATDFIQSEPAEGERAVEQTEVRILHDDEYVYLGIFARDSHPERIVVNDLKRDWNPAQSDWVAVVFDTFHDRRNCYNFAVNPLGAKWDAQVMNEGRDSNVNWDGVWTAHGRIAANGYYVEVAIPFKTLRFATGNRQTWGMNFMRRTRWRNEDSHWAPVGRVYGFHRMSIAGTLEGIETSRRGRDFRVKPYGLTSASQAGGARASRDADVGVDVKMGIGPGLTWDITVNTDFSQVEADEQQINLTRFSLFFPEKRDFFLENAGVFQFGPNNRPPTSGRGSTSPGAQARPNTIQNDVVLFFSRRIGLSDEGSAIPILAGTRLTGRSGRTTIGALNIQQRSGTDAPATNVAALRVRRDVLANSDIGVMLLNKASAGGHYNRVAAAEGNFRFFRNLNVNAFAARTFSPDAAVGGGGDEAAVHAGTTWRDRVWDLKATFTDIGSRFNDELGFVPRTGIRKGEVQVATHLRPRLTSAWLREIFPRWQLTDVRRQDGTLDSRYVDYHVTFILQEGSQFQAGINPTVENLIAPFTINNRRGLRLNPGRYEFSEYFALWNGDPSAVVSPIARFSTGAFYDGDKRDYQAGVTLRMTEHVNLASTWTRSDIDLPAGAFITDLLTTRINVSISTRTFASALVQYNTDAQQWTSNVRFNIIHRPLSDFFIVYNDRRDTRSGNLVDRALVAKMTYMMAF